MLAAKLPVYSPNTISTVNEELWGILSRSPDTDSSNSLQTRLIFFADYNAQALELASHVSGPASWQRGIASLTVHLPVL